MITTKYIGKGYAISTENNWELKCCPDTVPAELSGMDRYRYYYEQTDRENDLRVIAISPLPCYGVVDKDQWREWLRSLSGEQDVKITYALHDKDLQGEDKSFYKYADSLYGFMHSPDDMFACVLADDDNQSAYRIQHGFEKCCLYLDVESWLENKHVPTDEEKNQVNLIYEGGDLFSKDDGCDVWGEALEKKYRKLLKSLI